MAVCLDYQAVYQRNVSSVSAWRSQILAASLLFVALGFRVWMQIERTDLGYQLARERQRTMESDMLRRELEMQLSVLLRPDSLSQMARSRLGLRSLRAGQARKILLEQSGYFEGDTLHLWKGSQA